MARDDRWFRASCAFIVAAFVSYVVTLGLGVYLVPDVQNILGASFGLYPSPVGTAVGDAAGVGGLALVQALAVGAIAYLVAREAPPWRAVLGGLPVLWWLAPLGVHVLGVLLLVLGLVYGRTWALATAGLAHLGAVPVAVAQLVVRRRPVALAGGAALILGGVVGLAVTDYGLALRSGLIGPREIALAAICGLVTVALGFGPTAASNAPARPLMPFAVATFGLTVFSTAGDFTRANDPSLGVVLFAGSRYALPLAVCAVLLAARGSDGRSDGLRQSQPWGVADHA